MEPSRIGAARACRVVVSPPAALAASPAPGPAPLSAALILSERGVERCAISDRGPGFALDRQRPGARGGGRGLPGVALALILDEERRREDVAGAGRIDLARRPRVDLVSLSVDEQQGAVAVRRQDADGDALEPRDDLGFLSADVLAAQEQGL